MLFSRFACMGGFAVFASASPVLLVQHCELTPVLTSSAGLVPGDGSVEAYLANNILKEIAMNASTPSGYVNSFTNELGSIYQPDDYLTVTSLDAYNVSACAEVCSSNPNCQSFNIYFARAPKHQIVTGICEAPEAVTSVHCGLYSAGRLDASNTTNDHQYATSDQDSFNRVQLGSNGYYVAPADSTVAAFAAKDSLTSLAIDAEIAHRDTTGYMSGGPLSSSDADAAVADCADWCSNANEFGEKCKFFNVYKEVRAVNTIPVAETFKCAVFSKVLGSQWARNWGNDEIAEDGAKVSVRVSDSRTYACKDC